MIKFHFFFLIISKHIEYLSIFGAMNTLHCLYNINMFTLWPVFTISSFAVVSFAVAIV